MVTQELIAYIKSQKMQGKADEIIRNDLVANKWAESDINQAFLQINSLSAPASVGLNQTSSFESSQPQIKTFVQQADTSITSTEERPKMIKTVSTLVFLIAALYILSTVSMLGIMVIMDRAMGSGDLVFSFLKYFPSWGFIPIMFSLVTLIFFYVAFKVRNGSKFSLWLGIISLLVIPLSAVFMSQILMSPFINFVSNASGTTNEMIPKIPVNPSTFRFGDPIFILAFISLVLLLVSFKKFQFSNDPLSNKSKIFLIVLAVILILPTVSLVTLGYIKANETDFGYTNAKSQVNYHIYKPTPIQTGLTNATKFVVGKELAGKQNAVRVAYDIPFDTLVKTGQSRPIVITQVGVETGFNLDVFTTTFIKDATSQKITLPLAANQTGYLLQKPLGNSTLSAVVYLTNDNVLLTLMSPKAGSDELIQLASSLK
jgi:hypothetical protein